MQLEQVGNHCYAVVNPKNRLCESNSGLINLGGGVLIDTQCDLGHARRMMELFGAVWKGMPERVVITHEDADHVWGNQLFPNAQIIAQRKIHERLPHTADPRGLQRLQATARNWLTRIVLRVVDPAALALADQLAPDFDFDGIALTLPNTLFDERYELNLDGTEVHLMHVGPGHQWGDTLIHVPSQRVLYSGDVVFRQCTPMAWAGSYAAWQRSLDLVVELAPEVIVPGHGPVCGLEGPREMKAYLQYVYGEARQCFERGLSEFEAARRIDFGPYRTWNAPARLYLNVARAYREFRGEPDDAPWHLQRVFGQIYKLARARGLEVVF
jgi:glyoxylase-like metal-dependent hydrolase (beta-lactamase superfamily II)